MKAALFGVVALLVTGCTSERPANEKLSAIDNVVVIYAENHSFDNMYGMFPGANGIKNARPEQTVQRDHDGTVLPYLTVWGADGKPDASFPRLPNGPFRIDAPPVNRTWDQLVPGPIHVYYHHIQQIDGGKNDMFAAMSNVGGWVMGYYDGSKMKLWQWAKDYTLADNFFMGAFGGSFLNHQWLVCACTPEFKDAPPNMRAALEADGKLTKRPDSPSARDGAVKVVSASGGTVSPDGYVVNTAQPAYQPSGIVPAAGGDPRMANANEASGRPVPPQTKRTIGDTLSAKGIDWRWYGGGWNAATADGMKPPSEKRALIYNRDSQNFQPHHQPFNYYARFAPGTPDRERHLKDGDDFARDIDRGTLPPVAFYKPVGKLTQHPSYTDVASGDAHIAEVLERLKRSPQWSKMLVIVTYDENGGYWDHVPPPTGAGWGDRWGPGSRIPTLIIGPTVKKGAVDSTPYDTTSILKFVTRRFGLEPLPGVRANMGDLTAALE